eukprot:GHVU01193832.1.p1 GENE.GHVU01193832.1~~GHVU01193832.1.p1  ORF type:complete len:115 (+),score=4.27 GHVU01193832.1:766-1110(+)
MIRTRVRNGLHVYSARAIRIHTHTDIHPPTRTHALQVEATHPPAERGRHNKPHLLVHQPAHYTLACLLAHTHTHAQIARSRSLTSFSYSRGESEGVTTTVIHSWTLQGGRPFPS